MNAFVDFKPADMESVEELLRQDSRPVPAPLLEHRPSTLGTVDVANVVYTSPEIHDQEVEKLWKKVWQWACRLEEIPNVGDHVVYDVAHLSVIVVRVAPGNEPGSVRAFHNVCLHRGTQLRVADGNVPQFRCPFHGWTWNLDGTLDWISCAWDFPQVDEEKFSLPEVKYPASVCHTVCESVRPLAASCAAGAVASVAAVRARSKIDPSCIETSTSSPATITPATATR